MRIRMTANTIATASAVWLVPRPSTAISAKAKISDGIDWKMSVTRMASRSHQPPRKPTSRPIGTPTTSASATDSNEVQTAVRVP